MCFNTQLLKLSWPLAFATLRRMLRNHLEANLVTLNSILASCPWARCLHLLGQLRHGSLRPDGVTETQLLAACTEQWQTATRLSARAVLGPWQRSLTKSKAILPHVTAWLCSLHLLSLLCAGSEKQW